MDEWGPFSARMGILHNLAKDNSNTFYFVKILLPTGSRTNPNHLPILIASVHCLLLGDQIQNLL